jgi:hypothetical protein
MNVSAIAEKAPWHLWVVGILSLLWNLFGAVDFTMTNTRNAAYLAQFPPEMMQIIDTFPMWSIIAWGCGVWGALIGSFALLLRSRGAVLAFAISLVGLAVSQYYQATLDMPASMETARMKAMTGAIWAGAIFLLWYSWRQHRAGVLR